MRAGPVSDDGLPWRGRSKAKQMRRLRPIARALGSGGFLVRRRRDDAGQLERASAAPLEHLMLGLGRLREAVNLDEPLRRRRVVLVPLLVGRKFVAVEAVLALSADDHGAPLVQLHAGRS